MGRRELRRSKGVGGSRGRWVGATGRFGLAKEEENSVDVEQDGKKKLYSSFERGLKDAI